MPGRADGQATSGRAAAQLPPAGLVSGHL